MSLKLQEAIKDRDISLALARMHNNIRLPLAGAPAAIVEKSVELLDKSKKLLGDRFSIVQELYAEYSIQVDEENCRESAWRSRCSTCVHWKMTVDDDIDSWCERFTMDSRSYPAPCADYSAEDDGGMK